MYKCPRGCTGDAPDAFSVEEHTIGAAMLRADGTETAFRPARRERTGIVKCAECDARAEWIDARQVELFPVEPALC